MRSFMSFAAPHTAEPRQKSYDPILEHPSRNHIALVLLTAIDMMYTIFRPLISEIALQMIGALPWTMMNKAKDNAIWPSVV